MFQYAEFLPMNISRFMPFAFALILPACATSESTTALVTVQMEAESRLEMGIDVTCNEGEATDVELLTSTLNGIDMPEEGDKVDPNLSKAVCQGDVVTTTLGDELAAVLYSEDALPENLWDKALEAAEMSVGLFEQAKTAGEWADTVTALEGTIHAFESIPTGHPEYAEAEKQADAYTESLVEAQEKLDQLTTNPTTAEVTIGLGESTLIIKALVTCNGNNPEETEVVSAYQDAEDVFEDGYPLDPMVAGAICRQDESTVTKDGEAVTIEYM